MNIWRAFDLREKSKKMAQFCPRSCWMLPKYICSEYWGIPIPMIRILLIFTHSNWLKSINGLFSKKCFSAMSRIFTTLILKGERSIVKIKYWSSVVFCEKSNRTSTNVIRCFWNSFDLPSNYLSTLIQFCQI